MGEFEAEKVYYEGSGSSVLKAMEGVKALPSGGCFIRGESAINPADLEAKLGANDCIVLRPRKGSVTCIAVPEGSTRVIVYKDEVNFLLNNHHYFLGLAPLGQ